MKVKSFFYRIINALKFGYCTFSRPEIFQTVNLQNIVRLYDLIFKAQTDDKNYMTKIAVLYPDKTERAIVTLWVGAGVDSSPEKRITELLEENEELKRQLMKNHE